MIVISPLADIDWGCHLLSDKYGRKKIILPSVLIFSLGSAFTGLATGFASLVSIRTFIGGAEGTFNSAAVAQIAEESLPEERGKNVGIYNSAFPFMADPANTKLPPLLDRERFEFM
ncbi:hypothetical protein SPSIL_051790 [Sporomusa silvacetica DSM 10669]|uniref:Major facilitator superfamily (MFS) profile domain-containing protein n=1 Tax=Sporomusa silvacetica DSM 10669 TaxID=1123289 RepID=A0ABZ3IT98_9FIRM|nr:MFS transporter [Sporomusa silvacetica]OZC23863.1 putative niacin/nicotinamide transporter NaiP [Sporomusa silvacetica DSM 10669]